MVAAAPALAGIVSEAACRLPLCRHPRTVWMVIIPTCRECFKIATYLITLQNGARIDACDEHVDEIVEANSDL